MVTPASRTTPAATTPAVDAPAKTKGRLIELLKINPNYKLTRSVFNTELKSSNQAVRGLEKTTYVVAALFVGFVQTLHNLLVEIIGKGLVDMVILPINGVHSLLKKEKAEPVEVEMTPVATPTAEEARKLEEQPVAPKAETAAQPKPAHNNIWQTMKANPGKTALAVASMFATGAAAYYYAPVIASTISSWMGGASSASNFSNFSQFSNFSNFSSFSNFAGSNFGSGFVV